ncbi:DUF3891 family protein [Acidicapsa dinghuensis]|uniref:DUF3891 family protein n=1 Tax=Acidicapsa dinghuensis TaxID=2218256 RepID=A0ABW1EM09_9BACT|nr:DUF3891 family protein [Acidicapsa dinghuensis]
MLCMKTETGWRLITHQDHARLAGEFAAAWGNDQFRRPEPRDRVLFAIASHDDGWASRDAHPTITREGKPSAFSKELVDKYSAVEKIDLADYIALREQAVRVVAEQDPYAGLLVALHTRDLLVNRTDRSTIAPDQLPLLDYFLAKQEAWRAQLINWIQNHPMLDAKAKEALTIREHFCLLQACDALSLLACVEHEAPSTLLHPLPLTDGSKREVHVTPIGVRRFQLAPWPFLVPELSFSFRARHVSGHVFPDDASLEATFDASPVEMLSVTLSAPSQC